MEFHICCMLGGPLRDRVEGCGRGGEQPPPGFNTFALQNDVGLVSTIEAPSAAGRRDSGAIRRAAPVLPLRDRHADHDMPVASGEDIGFPVASATHGLRRGSGVWTVLNVGCEGRTFAALAPLLRRAARLHFLRLSSSLPAWMTGRTGAAGAARMPGLFGPDACGSPIGTPVAA